MNFTLHVWRQKGPDDAGQMKTYQATGINPDMSFLEMLDVVNQGLIEKGEEPIAFDHDCREGICGSCNLMINGVPHGPRKALPGGKREAKTTCQTYMRDFRDGEELYVEPFRAAAFPVIKDLVISRASFDRIIQAGGYVSANTGGAPDGNAVLVPKVDQERAMDAAACIGCGACVAACKNASAMLFVAAKVSHLGLLPQGQPERAARARRMVAQMDAEGFGNCTNYYECEAACPKEISAQFIARMNRDYLWASAKGEEEKKAGGAG
jgi:succinate dehydrogenase / fumarate reductase iron-sulfur subunit